MRRVAMLVTLGLLWAGGIAAVDKPAPTMPSEVTLTSGRVLRKVTVVRWEKERVVLKHAAGIDPIHFSIIAEPSRSQIMEFREEMKKPAGERRHAQTITGQVYVTTAGNGAYKFSGEVILIYPAAKFDAMEAAALNNLPSDYKNLSRASRALAAAEAWNKVLEHVKPVGSARTDADGKFTINLTTAEEVFLHCMATRVLIGGHEVNLWVERPNKGVATLSDDTLWDPIWRL